MDGMGERRAGHARRFAEETGLALIVGRSNLRKAFYIPHWLSCTYSNAFAVLALRKLWKAYYCASSGEELSSTFTLKDNDLHDVDPAPTPGYIATDTVTVDRVMHLGQVASTIDIPLETLRALNPQYKIDIIPASRKTYSLTLPVSYLSEYIENRDSIYAKDSLYLKEYMNPANLEKKRAEGVGYIYKVRQGDNLSVIAKRNRVSVKDLMRWNHLRSTVIRPGQRLHIERPKPRG